MNELIYNGKHSRDFGIYISGSGTFNSPERDAETISIPGKNGALEVSHNRFKNIAVEYPAFIVNKFKDSAAAARAWLLAASGYHRLEDTYHSEYFRLGRFTGPLDFDMKFLNRAGECKLQFDCKPQRFLKSGEEPITVANVRKTATGNPVSIKPNANGIKSAKLYGKTNQPGTGDPSPTNIRPISGVGEYRSNGYYTDIAVTTNGVPKTYTIGPMSAPLYDGDKLTWSGGSTVEVVRAKQSLVFNGTENWIVNDVAAIPGGHRFDCDNYNYPDAKSNIGLVCSHYKADVGKSNCVWLNHTVGSFGVRIGGLFADLSSFKSYLASTTVTIVYERATPTTETVPISEPITNAAGTVTLSAENTLDVVYEMLENGFIYNPTEFTALPLIRVYGTAPGTLTVGNTIVQINAISEYVDIDCELQDAFKGSINCNGNVYAPDFPALSPGGTGINFSGGITKIEIKPRWWTV